jgi:hypothetical protein
MKNLTDTLAEFDEKCITTLPDCDKELLRQSLTELVESCPIGIIIADKGSVNDKMIILDEWKEKVRK